MEAIVIHTQSEIFRPRAMVAIGFSMLGLLPLLYALHTLGVLDFLHPIQFIYYGVFGGMITILYYWPIVSAIVFGTLAYRTTSYKVICEQISCPADSLSLILKWKTLLQAVIHFISSFLLACVLTYMLGGRYSDMIITCDNSHWCLNEHKWFMVLFASILGLVWSLELSAFGGDCLQFPSTEMPVIRKLKQALPSLLKSSTKITRRVFMVYYFVYFAFGKATVWPMKTFFFLNDNVDTGLQSWSSMLDVRLFYQTYILGVFISFAWSLSHFFFQACITKHAKFELTDAKNDGSLLAALALEQDNLTKMLALKDLYMMSKNFEDSRRQKIFSLSNPGGHPKTWNAIRSVTTSSLSQLVERIETNNKLLVASYKTIMSHQAGKIETLKPGYNSSSYTGAAPKVVKKWYYPAFLYVVYPDHLSGRIFYDSQKHIWSLSALSSLVVRSFTEDKFGIVQQNLGEIITLLISLNRVMENLFRTAPVLGKKYTNCDINKSSHALGVGLQLEIRSSLEAIATTFHPHINHICGLSSDNVKELQGYVK